MTDPTQNAPTAEMQLRPDRRVYVYFSKEAWEAMQRLTGGEKGSLSSTINQLILEEDRRQHPHLYE